MAKGNKNLIEIQADGIQTPQTNNLGTTPVEGKPKKEIKPVEIPQKVVEARAFVENFEPIKDEVGIAEMFAVSEFIPPLKAFHANNITDPAEGQKLPAEQKFVVLCAEIIASQIGLATAANSWARDKAADGLEGLMPTATLFKGTIQNFLINHIEEIKKEFEKLGVVVIVYKTVAEYEIAFNKAMEIGKAEGQFAKAKAIIEKYEKAQSEKVAKKATEKQPAEGEGEKEI